MSARNTVAQRAGDADRDAAITKLNDAFTRGYLTQEERDERVALAFNAKIEDELPPLLADLAKIRTPPKITSMGPSQLDLCRQQIAELTARLQRQRSTVWGLYIFTLTLYVGMILHFLFPGVH
jgi:hypothetical protein